MNRNEKKFNDILNLLMVKFGQKLECFKDDASTHLRIKDSHFWMSNDFGEFIVGFGFNHTHFSEKYNNLDEGLVQAFDLLTNKIKTTNYIKGKTIFKTTIEIEYTDSTLQNIGTSALLIYPFWKKTKIQVIFSDKLIEKYQIEEEANFILNDE